MKLLTLVRTEVLYFYSWHTVLCVSQTPAQCNLPSHNQTYGEMLSTPKSTVQTSVGVIMVLIDNVGSLIITLICGTYSPPGTLQLVKIFQAHYRCPEIFAEFLGL